MAWLASLASAGISAGSNSQSNKGNKKGTAAQIAAQQKAYEDAKASLGQYAGLGPGAVNRLGALMGLEGYRTKSDISLRELLAGRPTMNGSSNERDFRTTLDKQEEYSTAGDSLGGVTKYFKGRTKKRQKKADAANAAAAAKYQTDLAAWEVKKAELEKQRDIELQTYDPTAELRKTPGYQYRYDTGLTTANNSLSRLGMAQSGRGEKERIQYGQNFASNEFNNEFNRLTGAASGGQNAATTIANVGIGQGSALSDIYGTQARNNSSYYGNLNQGLQGTLANFTYGNERGRNARSSSYDVNSPTTNNDYRPGQTLEEWNYN